MSTPIGCVRSSSVCFLSLATATAVPSHSWHFAAPHIVKPLGRSGGSYPFRIQLLMGALMVLASDLIEGLHYRTLQVGVVTGALGGLYLIYLIYLERKKS